MKTIGRIAAEDGDQLASWLNSFTGRATTRCSDSEPLALWISLAQSVSLSMPHVEATTQDFSVDGSLWQASGMAKLLQSGYVAIEFRFTSVTFTPRWANPLWDGLAVNVSTESDQILQSVQLFANSVAASNVSWGTLADENLATADIGYHISAKSKQLWRCVYLASGRLIP